MSGPLTPPLKPDCGSYPADPNFPVSCDVDYTQAYCCMNEESTSGGGFVNCQPAVDICMVGPPGCHMAFPTNNDEGQPMLKTALNGTTMAAWAKIGFQGYCSTFENADDTAETIVTMGNVSQPFNDEQCMATITAFQYGWGTVNQGNRCRVTILDQKGSTFQQWVQRMGINPEGDSTPIQGKYRMKVQFGWYTTGGGDGDVCGQAATPIMPVNSGGILPIATPAAGLNSAYIICSPVMYFITDWINVHYEDGKFIYELEGVDLLVRGQENMIQKTLGSDLNGMYFTKAVQLLGQMSFPPFRVEFKCIDATGAVVDMQFALRDGIAGASDRQCKSASDCAFYDGDCQGYGPFGKWKAYTKPPIAVIQQWIKDNNVCALDLTGLATSNRSRVGITMNYDPIYKFIPGVTSDDFCQTECSANLPNYGRLILWAGNGIPYGQGNFSDSQMNQRMKAVYLVNGGNCQWHLSEVLTEDGWNYIGNIYRKKYSGKVACVDEDGNLTWSKVTNWYRNNLDGRKLIKIHLHNSRQRAGSVSGAIFTEDHPILTDKGYVEVKDLKTTEHLIHSGTCCPSQEVHEAITGMILGDGHIRRKSFSFNCTHCGEQKEYIEHKAKILELQTVNKPDKVYKKIKITSRATPYWRNLRKLFYPDGIKVINESILKDFTLISLAYLYMDDGSISRKLAQIATCCFTDEEVDLLIKKIEKLGINCYRRKNNKYPRIYFNTQETIKLCKALAKYIIPSMDYKILPEYRIEKKTDLQTDKRPFYDKFDLIRCENLENKTKYVYCIDVEKYHNFITHSGVVHNCSPVLHFAPSFRWHSMAAQKAAGSASPRSGRMDNQIAGAVKTLLAIVPSTGPFKILSAVATNIIMKISDPVRSTMETTYHSVMSNLAIGAIEADLKIQGDPSDWLCSPAQGYGKCVGIVFINPFFLFDGGGDCPVWSAGVPGDQNFAGICNELLTSKGWFIMGADHQIKDGQYITTLKLKLIAPGAELNPATNPPTNLGGWSYASATPLPYGGQFGCLNKTLVGNTGTGWGNADPGTCGASWVGGVAACSPNYDSSADLPPD